MEKVPEASAGWSVLTVMVLPVWVGSGYSPGPTRSGSALFPGAPQEAWLTELMLKSGTRRVGIRVSVK